jgi:phage shock protein PspC (stress-responsive transcriptional regulator)
MGTEIKKLYRSRTDRMLGGVCGGLGEYFAIDSTLIRILFVVLTFGGGSGFLAYLIMLFIVPEEPLGSTEVQE